MSYTKSDMLYIDYKWTAWADHDKPKIVGGTDYAGLIRAEVPFSIRTHTGVKNWVFVKYKQV